MPVGLLSAKFLPRQTPSAIVPNVRLWWLGQFSGTSLVDVSGHNNHGSFVGSPLKAGSNERGARYGSLFPNVSGYASFGDNANLEPTDQLTVWVRFAAFKCESNQMIYSKGFTEESKWWDFIAQNDGYLRFNSDSVDSYYEMSGGWVENRWHFAAMTFDGTNWRMYIKDGANAMILHDTQAGTAVTNNGVVRIGAGESLDGFDGRIAECGLANCVLSLEQLQMLERIGRIGYPGQIARTRQQFPQSVGGGGGSTRGSPFGVGNAFNGGRTFHGILA